MHWYLLNRLQGVKDSEGTIAHIHIFKQFHMLIFVGFAFVTVYSKSNH